MTQQSIEGVVENTAGGPTDEAPDPGRRWFGGILALLGGGAVLSACDADANAGPPDGLRALSQGVTATDLQYFDSIADLRSFNNASTYTFAIVLGYSTRGDGGGGIFTWSTPSTADAGCYILNDDDGIIIVSSAATAGYWRRLYSGPIDVRWFGAKGDGSTPDTARIQAAINSSGGGHRATDTACVNAQGYVNIYFPQGNYLIDSTIKISHDRTQLIGDGIGTTTILFEPSCDDTCFEFNATPDGLPDQCGMNNGILYQCSFKKMSFLSHDTSHAKVCIELYDTSSFTLEDVAISITKTTGGKTSVGVICRGREFTTFNRCNISIDRPVWLRQNHNCPASSEDVDLCTFQQTSFNCESEAIDSAGVLVDAGVTIGNCYFNEVHFIGGRYGFYWSDPNSTTPRSSLLTFLNVKTETFTQPHCAGEGYAIYISPSVLDSLVIRNVRFGSSDATVGSHKNRGLYIRNSTHVTIENCYFPSADTSLVADDPVLNIDSTCYAVQWRNCVFFQEATISTGTLDCVKAEQAWASRTPPHSAFYSRVNSAAGLNLTWRERDVYVNRYTGTLAASGTFDLVDFTNFGGRIGTVTVHAYDTTAATQAAGTAAIMKTSGGTTAIAKTAGTSNFDVTATPSLLLSWVSGLPRLKNNFANSIDYMVTLEYRT